VLNSQYYLLLSKLYTLQDLCVST